MFINAAFETAKEEKPLVLNEALVAMNAQLTEKIRALEEINDDLNNLLVSSGMPTLFLDPRLRYRIQKYGFKGHEPQGEDVKAKRRGRGGPPGSPPSIRPSLA
ncbi:hypothetical protein G3480_04090 [Thiorhodococcus mannitoliphagus]|uniref:Uncharacterized protein n=1 Tax=Thiorhodococcus mannitoliphagus TaxID=329406 RepID=A0A6P1DRF7_9GAMM|nr:hypothetical protein [Thiorhodococcus mannitoliphagus]NEX19501.1 hypothetical protein [Thiorhodococcus mannitoliphagus]